MADTTDSKSVGSNTVWVQVPPAAPYRPVAQLVELAAHNRLVGGSSPSWPTRTCFTSHYSVLGEKSQVPVSIQKQRIIFSSGISNEINNDNRL